MAILKIAVISCLLAGVCYADEGTASWYSVESCLREGTSGITASGERLKDEEYTCASWDYCFGTTLLVVCLDSGKSVRVRVNDRGPAKRLYKKGRIIDLSRAAFKEICSLSKGICRVEVSICE